MIYPPGSDEGLHGVKRGEATQKSFWATFAQFRAVLRVYTGRELDGLV